MNDQWLNNDLYEYTIYSLRDTASGGTDINTLNNILNKYAKSVLQTKQLFTNELGHNSSSIGYGGFSVGSNATID